MIQARAVCLVTVLATAVVSERLAAQTCVVPGPGEPPVCDVSGGPSSRFSRHATALGVNVTVSALTAAVSQKIKGKSFWKGFAGGALGGTISYAGKAVIAQEFDGAGLLGRQINGIGASIVNNAAADQNLVERLVLPVGPIRLHVYPLTMNFRAKLDVTNLAIAGYTATQDNVVIDWNASLLSGTAVFVDYNERTWSGRHRGGVMVSRHHIGPPGYAETQMSLVLRHERVHLAQYDFSSIVWGEPAERWLMERIPGGRVMHRYLDFRLDHIAWIGVHHLAGGEITPLESEAKLLSRSK